MNAGVVKFRTSLLPHGSHTYEPLGAGSVQTLHNSRAGLPWWLACRESDCRHLPGLKHTRTRRLQVRDRVKDGFHKQAGLRDELEIKRAVNRGRWWTREMVGVIQLKKYRRMRHSYKPF